MGIITQSYGLNSFEFIELIKKNTDYIVNQNVPAYMEFVSSDAFINYDYNENIIKPYIEFIGRIQSVEVYENMLPFNITHINYSNDTLYSYRYNLTRKSLSELVNKGLFEYNFSIPDDLKHSSLMLPCTLSSVTFIPKDLSSNTALPIIFSDVDIESMQGDDNNTGYNIAEYFYDKEELELDVKMPQNTNKFLLNELHNMSVKSDVTRKGVSNELAQNDSKNHNNDLSNSLSFNVIGDNNIIKKSEKIDVSQPDIKYDETNNQTVDMYIGDNVSNNTENNSSKKSSVSSNINTNVNKNSSYTRDREVITSSKRTSTKRSKQVSELSFY